MQLPRVCWFQEIEYHIVLMRFENGRYIEAIRTEPQRIEYLKTQSVQEMFMDIQKDFEYKALAIFKTFAENDESLTESVKVETIICKYMVLGHSNLIRKCSTAICEQQYYFVWSRC